VAISLLSQIYPLKVMLVKVRANFISLVLEIPISPRDEVVILALVVLIVGSGLDLDALPDDVLNVA
jgi:hypothetical protein